MEKEKLVEIIRKGFVLNESSFAYIQQSNTVADVILSELDKEHKQYILKVLEKFVLVCSLGIIENDNNEKFDEALEFYKSQLKPKTREQQLIDEGFNVFGAAYQFEDDEFDIYISTEKIHKFSDSEWDKYLEKIKVFILK